MAKPQRLGTLRHRAEGLRERFERDGVVLVMDTLPLLAVKELAQRVERYRDWLIPIVPKEWIRFESDGSVRGMYCLDRIDPFFRVFGKQDNLRKLVERVSGAAAHFSSIETLDKPAEEGGAILPHQDAMYVTERQAAAIQIWIPLDATRAENGALRYWLGTHRQELFTHEPVSGRPYLQAVPDSVVHRLGPPAVAELDPGSVAVHSDRILHASPANTSPQQRRDVIVTFKVDNPSAAGAVPRIAPGRTTTPER